MNRFLTLVNKEIIELMRNGKLIWLPVVLMILGISQPLTSYYMPQILDMAGNLPEGASITIPTPSGEEVLIGALSQYGTIGTLLFVLATMNVIAQERQNGSITLVMVRPVNEWQYIGSKYVVQLALLLTSLILSYCITWYYTNLLFTTVDWKVMMSSLFIYSFWVLFVVSVTLFVGTFLEHNGGIAGVSLLFLSLISLLTSLLPKFMEWSPGNLRVEATKLLVEQQWSQSTVLVIGSTTTLSLLLFISGVLVFRRLSS
ncbi:ABC transporter permease subunit [Alkalihalobacillus macyae]|uniref:ABC transporter permease subunit n=1 Tax=Guptibacillus hwajinpoensis TaxID=208199 RepID=UPI00273C2BBD|nr:ABC transporter permease subunit [Alkalihalobacillus macyae]MDP4549669.1 ABC transporter permease subunit [Alkalihalobacillus macyae]